MSLSCSDLICREDSSTVFSLCAGDEPPEYSSEYLESSPSELDEAIAGLLEDEVEQLAGVNSITSPQSTLDASLRAESIAWILKVHSYYGFQPLTAYLAVNYFDRFLYVHYLPKLNGWPLQLLSVACLSLAAKMEEPLVPSLLDLQMDGEKFMFEPKNVQKMELLVLRVLDWRLRCISPFCYLSYFAAKIDTSGIYNGFLISRAKDIIISTIQETSLFIEHRPSCIAASSILCAANDLPNFSSITAHHAEKWSAAGLHKDSITSCYKIIQQIVIKNKAKKQPKVLPQLRVMARANVSSSTSADTSSSSSSSSSPYCKRRKLNNHPWESDDKTSSE